MKSLLYSIVDTILEWTVPLSFSRIGFSLRKFFWHEDDLAVDLSGKVCIVTGANSGLGFETSKQLAKQGARVYMLVRDADRGLRAIQQIQESLRNAEVILKVVDLSQLVQIQAFLDQFIEEEQKLDILVHNAGVLLDRRELTEDGLEKTLATNVVGPFMLTQQLLPLMERSADARVINVSSGGMYTQRLDLRILQGLAVPFNGVISYAQTKRAQVALTELWTEKTAGGNVAFYAMHPGWVDTPGLRSSLPGFARIMRPLLRSQTQGADTIVWLAAVLNLDQKLGSFWHDRMPRKVHKTTRTIESLSERQALWELCERLSGGRQVDTEPEQYVEVTGEIM